MKCMFRASVFNCIEQFPKDPWQIGSVEFIDDQKELVVRVFLRRVCEIEENARPDLVGKTLALAQYRSDALNKILVCIGGMERDVLDASVFAPGQEFTKRLGHKGFPCTWRTLKKDST